MLSMLKTHQQTTLMPTTQQGQRLRFQIWFGMRLWLLLHVTMLINVRETANLSTQVVVANTVSTGDMSGRDAVRLWVNEKADYDYNSNSCASGKQCGHYTQVVWKNTKRVGCAKVRCNNGGTFITCNYDPPGNYVGQRPY
ncbi:Ves allergen [Sesbania bispinosa]|nr:Ves allergen [Sesbania bispinosa]